MSSESFATFCYSFLNTQNLCRTIFKLVPGILYCNFFFYFTGNFYQVWAGADKTFQPTQDSNLQNFQDIIQAQFNTSNNSFDL